MNTILRTKSSKVLENSEKHFFFQPFIPKTDSEITSSISCFLTATFENKKLRVPIVILGLTAHVFSDLKKNTWPGVYICRE